MVVIIMMLRTNAKEKFFDLVKILHSWETGFFISGKLNFHLWNKYFH